MPAPLDGLHLDAWRARVDGLGADAQRSWGKMQPIEVLAHLRAAVRLSLGQIELPDESTALYRNALVQWFILGPMPWPKGKIQAPGDFQPTPGESFESEQAKLKKAMGRFVDTLGSDPDRATVHPAFGSLTLRKWAKLHGKHFDHHLKQFGA